MEREEDGMMTLLSSGSSQHLFLHLTLDQVALMSTRLRVGFLFHMFQPTFWLMTSVEMYYSSPKNNYQYMFIYILSILDLHFFPHTDLLIHSMMQNLI